MLQCQACSNQGKGKFQSSPGPKAGCYHNQRARKMAIRGFNPHPARKPDATHLRSKFKLTQEVSILTRPESRMLRVNNKRAIGSCRFQSSPGPKAGCYFFLSVMLLKLLCFNPHPARKPDATGAIFPMSSMSDGFNPHPARKPDATSVPLSISTLASGFNPHPARKPDATVRAAVAIRKPVHDTRSANHFFSPEKRDV